MILVRGLLIQSAGKIQKCIKKRSSFLVNEEAQLATNNEWRISNTTVFINQNNVGPSVLLVLLKKKNVI